MYFTHTIQLLYYFICSWMTSLWVPVSFSHTLVFLSSYLITHTPSHLTFKINVMPCVSTPITVRQCWLTFLVFITFSHVSAPSLVLLWRPPCWEWYKFSSLWCERERMPARLIKGGKAPEWERLQTHSSSHFMSALWWLLTHCDHDFNLC